MTRLTLITILIVFAFSFSYSQNNLDTLTYQIETVDGNVYVGKIIKRTNGVIDFQTETIGKIQILESNVKSIQEILPNGKNWPSHFQSSFYFVFPSGYGLKKGEGTYQNIWIMFNTLTYGVTDKFSIGIGTIPIFLFGADAFPVWVTPKFSIPVVDDMFNVGVGGLVGSAGGESFGFMYGITTFGSRDANISIGLSKPVNEGPSDLLALLNASIRISKKTYLLTENYFVGGDSFSYFGARSMIGRSSVEYGIARSGDFDFIGIPILGVTIPLHKE